jgi:plasmid stability protein
MDLTIHDLPIELHQALTVRAAAEKTSVAKALVEAAAEQLGVALPPPTSEPNGNGAPKKYRDLSFLTDGPPLEPEVLAALEEQRRIDPEMWK